MVFFAVATDAIVDVIFVEEVVVVIDTVVGGSEGNCGDDG